MKKLFLASLIGAIFLSGCGNADAEQEAYNRGYEAGYHEGYRNGYDEAMLDYSYDDERGFNPDEYTDEELAIMQEDFEEYVQDYIEENY